MDKKCTIIISGGLDSSTLIYQLYSEGYKLHAVSFLYGQKHSREIECAKKIVSNLAGIKHTIIDISYLGKELNSALTNSNENIPEGHYQAENMRRTVVPNRNMIMATIAHAIGYSNEIKNIALGIHAGDHFIYPDCRPEFIKEFEKTLRLSNDDEEINVITPFVNISKTEILKIGLELGVPYENTWTCYVGGDLACGKCGSCNERLSSFKECKTQDPLFYAE